MNNSNMILHQPRCYVMQIDTEDQYYCQSRNPFWVVIAHDHHCNLCENTLIFNYMTHDYKMVDSNFMMPYPLRNHTPAIEVMSMRNIYHMDITEMRLYAIIVT